MAHGGRPNVIPDAVSHKPVGTRFLPTVNRLESRKRWILSERTNGVFVADEGAVRALRSGKSLLPVGVRQVIGSFERGEFVAVHDLDGREVARGITRYSATNAARIAGKRSDQIEKILGYNYAPLLIHADDLVVL